MRIGFTVNAIATEIADYTTTHLAMTATNMGHEVYYINVGDLALWPDNHAAALACRAPARHYRSPTVYLGTLLEKGALREHIPIDSLDVLFLRNDPSEDMGRRPWAALAAICFGRLAREQGVIVLNDPDGMAIGLNKLYLQYFSEQVRPKTLISRDRQQLKAFIRAEGGRAVLKPLAGSGGRNVFLVRPEDAPNINQMIEAISEDNFVIAQEYLPDAVNGDTRLFLVNGRPLRIDDSYAAMQRVRRHGDPDMRSNMSAGATAARARVTDKVLEVAEVVRPRLIQDGMFFVGLDIVGDKLMEINVQSPGGLNSVELLEGKSFVKAIVHALERKVAYVHEHDGVFDNVTLATLDG
jgi:glutathione synthase